MDAGTRLGAYEIVGPLGAGGMGEVYRARDANLDREVAIKVLPEDFAADAERLGRFEREARLLASLNHPNIATVHGFEESDGVRFLAMELVEGATLDDRITASGPIELDEALEIGAQIAEALETAHEAGIVHRDLKPANVKVAPDGQVKVLDFGLAKAYEADGSPAGGSDLSQSPTRAAATRAGWILGTAAYMSPEQARGRPLDRRTDIWAFGCVLYEMLTAEPAFDGETATDVMAAIVRQDPDWGALPDETPAALERLLRRCLDKDARQRLRDMGDARIELREILEGGRELLATERRPESAAVRPESTGAASPRRTVAVALIVGAAAALAGWLLGASAAPDPVTAPVSRASISLPAGQRQPRVLQSPLAITRDGSLLAYVARDADGIINLYLRPMDSFEARKVPASHDARAPFFSPDGAWLGFFADGAIRKALVEGGEPLEVTRASSTAFGASWGPDDTIVYAPTINAGLWRVSADGDEPEQLTRPDFAEGGYAHVWPQHLPGGRHVMFATWGAGDGSSVRVLDLETGEIRGLGSEAQSGYVYLSSGHLAYADSRGSGRLLAVPFDLESLSPRGHAVPVLDDVRYMDSQSADPYLAVSEGGTVVYASQEIGDASVAWVDRDGDLSVIRTGPEIVAGIQVAPDGRSAVFYDEQGAIWLLDLERGALDVLLRSDRLFSLDPVWHPDGRRLTLTSNDAGSWDLYEMDVVERGEPTLLLQRENDQYPGSWSGDGRLLAYVESNPETAADVWVLPEGGEPVPVARSPVDDTQPALSPDGDLIAYVSEDSGRRQVYVQRYPAGERLDVSLDGGQQPVWAPDGDELFFRRGDQLLSVDVTAEPEIRVSRPAEVFEMAFDFGSGFSTTPYYDISPDGERFLVVTDRPTTEFKVIFNWFRELGERVPVGE